MSTFFSWEFLGTFAGAAAATGFIVQSIKDLCGWPTQIVSYLVALGVLFLTTATLGGDWTAWMMVPLNAVTVSLAANGGYAAAQRISGNKLE